MSELRGQHREDMMPFQFEDYVSNDTNRVSRSPTLGSGYNDERIPRNVPTLSSDPPMETPATYKLVRSWFDPLLGIEIKESYDAEVTEDIEPGDTTRSNVSVFVTSAARCEVMSGSGPSRGTASSPGDYKLVRSWFDSTLGIEVDEVHASFNAGPSGLEIQPGDTNMSRTSLFADVELSGKGIEAGSRSKTPMFAELKHPDVDPYAADNTNTHEATCGISGPTPEMQIGDSDPQDISLRIRTDTNAEEFSTLNAAKKDDLGLNVMDEPVGGSLASLTAGNRRSQDILNKYKSVDGVASGRGIKAGNSTTSSSSGRPVFPRSSSLFESKSALASPLSPQTVLDDDQKPATKVGLGIVQFFHLSWFAAVMGWGGTALVINGFPGVNDNVKRYLNLAGTAIWLWDVIYCVIFSTLLILRMVRFPRAFWQMMKTNSFLFFGCVPMGIAVIGMGFAAFGDNIMPRVWAQEIAHAVFWLDVGLCIISMTVPQIMMVIHQHHTLDTMPSLLLLPFVSCIVASAMAGTVGPFMRTLELQQNVNVAGYILWGAGILTAASIIPLYMFRIISFGFPPSALGNSVWVVLGPIGQGANAILMLGRHTGKLQCTGQLCPGGLLVEHGLCLCAGFLDTSMPLNPMSSWGNVAPGVTQILGLAMWGFGLWWIFMASSASLYHIACVGRALAQLKKLGNIAAVPSCMTATVNGSIHNPSVSTPHFGALNSSVHGPPVFRLEVPTNSSVHGPGSPEVPQQVNGSVLGPGRISSSFPRTFHGIESADVTNLQRGSSGSVHGSAYPRHIRASLSGPVTNDCRMSIEGSRPGTDLADKKESLNLSDDNTNKKVLHVQKGMPFNVAWWGVVFPFVTLNMATYQLYINTRWSFFMWMGRIFAVILTMLSIFIHYKTIKCIWSPVFWRKFHKM